MDRIFHLYPEERHWFSFQDYGAVLDVMRHLQPKRVLEFGPGSSTLALIEGGAESIDTCEDALPWYRTAQARLAAVYPVVSVHLYRWSDPVSIPALDGRVYDLALIDGPYGTPQRPASVEFALQRSTAVLVPTEDHGRRETSVLRPIILALAAKYQRVVSFMETGPLSGGFALMTPC